jgi:HEAT repeat protein
VNKRRKYVVYALIALALLAAGAYLSQRQRHNRVLSLGQDLASADASKAYEALRRLQAMGPSVAPQMAEQLTADKPALRARAAWVLGMSGDPQYGAEIAKLLAPSQPPEVRASAAEAVGVLGYQGAAETLIAMVEDEAPEVSRSAILALGKLGAPEAQQALKEVLSRPAEEESMREAATLALGALHTPGAVHLLVQHLGSDENPQVRQLCAEALGQAEEAGTDSVAGAERALREALAGEGRDENSGVRIAAAHSLGLLAVSEAPEEKREALRRAAEQDPHYWVRAAAEEALD